jgi:hypothetical protein
MKSMRMIVVVVAGMAGSAASAKPPPRVVPWIFDPTDTDAVSSAWVPFSGPGNSDPALVLTKFVGTGVEAAAGAEVEGVDGKTLYELGFDYYNGSHCGAGAPRFNVTVSTPGGDKLFFFGCTYGTPSLPPDKPKTFTRLRFSDGDAFPQIAGDVWPGFGVAQVKSIDIVFDEGTDQGSGFAALDNIDVNGDLIGRGH